MLPERQSIILPPKWTLANWELIANAGTKRFQTREAEVLVKCRTGQSSELNATYTHRQTQLKFGFWRYRMAASSDHDKPLFHRIDKDWERITITRISYASHYCTTADPSIPKASWLVAGNKGPHILFSWWEISSVIPVVFTPDMREVPQTHLR